MLAAALPAVLLAELVFHFLGALDLESTAILFALCHDALLWAVVQTRKKRRPKTKRLKPPLVSSRLQFSKGVENGSLLLRLKR